MCKDQHTCLHAPIVIIIRTPEACTLISPTCTGTRCNCQRNQLDCCRQVESFKTINLAWSNYYTLTAKITPEQTGNTVRQHWCSSSFLLQICNISTAHVWRKRKILASYGSLSQSLKRSVPAKWKISIHPNLHHSSNSVNPLHNLLI